MKKKHKKELRFCAFCGKSNGKAHKEDYSKIICDACQKKVG